MMTRLTIILTATAALAGCATVPSGQVAGLTGAKIGANGMATILEVPASPFPADPPPLSPQSPSLVETYARNNGLTISQAEAEINGTPEFQRDLQALTARLRQQEPANFVGVRIVRDPRVTAEISLKRDAAATLARYTRDPQFRAVEGGRTEAEMKALSDRWIARMQEEALPAAIGADLFAGRLEIEMGLSEAEWTALAKQKGWTWGPEVQFKFAADRPAALANGTVYPFHLFPRSRAAATIILTSATGGRVVLKDGCFRLGKDGPLALFDRNAQIGRDAEGYLAVFENGKVASRIGEPVIYGGYPGAVESDPDVRALRQACGSGPIAAIGIPSSERLFALPYPEWIADYARVKSITYDAAWDRIVACMKRREETGHRGLAMRTGCIDQFN